MYMSSVIGFTGISGLCPLSLMFAAANIPRCCDIANREQCVAL